MENSYIGIRLADGRFFPIFEQDHIGRKRLVLTTVTDKQASVKIDLYRGIGEEMREAEYVGTLVIQNVEEGPAGEPEISLILGRDAEGNLNATASDEKSGEYESLSVSLEPEAPVEAESGDFELDEDAFDFDENVDLDSASVEDFDMPDLDEPNLDEELSDFETSEQTSDGSEDYSPQTYAADYDYEEAPPRFEEDEDQTTEEPVQLNTVNLLLFVAFIVLSLAGLGLLTYLVFQALRGPDLPSLVGGTGAAVVETVRTALSLL